jgi:putative membrane protein
MRDKLNIFITRWLLNSIGLWVSVRLFGTGYDDLNIGISVFGFLLAGFIFSIVNSVLKPIFVVLSLPAIFLTLGIFVLVVNGLMVYISLGLTPGIEMTFPRSILAGIVLSLINYIVSAVILVKEDNQAK